MPSVDRIVVGSCHPGDNNKMKQKMSIISDIGYLKGEKNKIMKQKIFVSFFPEKVCLQSFALQN